MNRQISGQIKIIVEAREWDLLGKNLLILKLSAKHTKVFVGGQSEKLYWVLKAMEIDMGTNSFSYADDKAFVKLATLTGKIINFIHITGEEMWGPIRATYYPDGKFKIRDKSRDVELESMTRKEVQNLLSSAVK